MRIGIAGSLFITATLVLNGCVATSSVKPVSSTAFYGPLKSPIEVAADFDFDTLSAKYVAFLERPADTCSPDKHPTLTASIEWNLWNRIRGGFAIPIESHSRIDSELRWYASNQEYLDRVADRAEPYLHHIVNELERRHMPAELALLPIVESAFQPFAYSPGRAAGIWQFIPSTGRIFDLDQNWWYDGRRDILASTEAALDYLQKLQGYFNGDWLLALAAYNSGAGTVLKAIKRNRKRGKPTNFWSLKLPAETKTYVPRLLALRDLVADPKSAGIVLQPIPDQRYFATVELDSQIDLAMAADLAGISVEEIYRLNPGFNRWATAPKGPHRLVLPLQNVEKFESGLASIPKESRVSWQRHRIKSGESLGLIARKYRTTVGVLQRVNGIRGHTIRAGRHLLIPVASRSLNSYTLSAEQRLRRIKSTPRGKSKLIHVVTRGDTLWDISRSYQVSVGALARWNGMAPRDPLKPGQRLVIWQQNSAKKAALHTPSHGERIQRLRYTVRRGDSLARIAKRFRVTVDKLQRWNGIKKGAYLQPGQVLTLYVDVTRQS